MRWKLERVTNNLLLLYLIDQANERGNVENDLKLQKLVFLSQMELMKRGLKAFSYNFFRWLKGPFSKNLAIDKSDLAEVGLVKVSRKGIELTNRGKELLKDCRQIFEEEENRKFVKYIDEIIEKYAQFSPDEIKDIVYSMEVTVPKIREIMNIKEIPLGKLILFKTADRNASDIFHISGSWLATFEIMFDKEALSSLERAVDDAVEGRADELTL
ncbi:MAG: type II toxin-antitoxin system antitoxin SocA domain-containing protein [Candidatus Freyarchaeota archaeon]